MDVRGKISESLHLDKWLHLYKVTLFWRSILDCVPQIQQWGKEGAGGWYLWVRGPQSDQGTSLSGTGHPFKYPRPHESAEGGALNEPRPVWPLRGENEEKRYRFINKLSVTNGGLSGEFYRVVGVCLWRHTCFGFWFRADLCDLVVTKHSHPVRFWWRRWGGLKTSLEFKHAAGLWKRVALTSSSPRGHKAAELMVSVAECGKGLAGNNTGRDGLCETENSWLFMFDKTQSSFI